jgi:UDP-N-acetylglucosamine pyrophosphorylase
MNHFPEFEAKMRAAGLSAAAIDAFRHSYDMLVAGHTGMIPESSIRPVTDLPHLRSRGREEADAADDRKNPPPHVGGYEDLLNETVIIKLNGGLGTSMGLERAKSLLPVKEGLTFLDFIVKQILELRKRCSVQLRFLLMNSFSTSADTLEFLGRYPELGDPKSLELMQNQVPKVDAKTLRPVAWPQNPQLEWCPPGHGDLYPSLLGSGILDKLLGEGIKYAFVSNSDNLGATLDLELLQFFAESNKPFLMEVAERTPSDKKGGHLARRGDTLLLRESAQCPEADMPAFQDIQKHRFFNTNSIWLRLDHLKKLFEAKGGFVPLPLIKNSKTVDPRDKNSPPVFQLETAMGAAIECFEGAGAIVVPRSRFAPVKTTADLLALRSDAYVVTPAWRIELASGTREPPTIDLDSSHYKLVDQLDEKLTAGVPSLKDCRELIVRGPVAFDSRNIFSGKVSIANKSAEIKPLPSGSYGDCEKQL